MDNRSKYKIIYRLLTVALVCCLVLLLTGCLSRNEKKMRELREDGIAFMKEGDYSAAIVRFDQALSLNSGKVTDVEKDILLYRAEAEVRTGDYGAAEYTYSLLLKEEPDNTDYMDLRVICMVKSGADLKKTLELFRKADELSPDTPGHRKALYILGSALIESGNGDHISEAKQLYARAMEGDGGATAELYNRMGSLSFMEGDYSKALGYFNAGIELIESDPDNEEKDVLKYLEYNKAVCYEYKHEYRKALKLFEEYRNKYGDDDIIEHETAFLKSRVR